MNNEAKSIPQKEMMPKFPCTHQIFHVQEEKLFLESINQNGSQINKDIPFCISLTFDLDSALYYCKMESVTCIPILKYVEFTVGNDFRRIKTND